VVASTATAAAAAAAGAIAGVKGESVLENQHGLRLI
jgi:hypothetical protein